MVDLYGYSIARGIRTVEMRKIKGKEEYYNIRNPFMAFAHVVNLLSNNWMIVQKQLSQQLFCLMS